MSQEKELTPLMKQYWSVKEHHMDKIVLFRMGDFFEMFNEDALEAAPIMGIALTIRNRKSGDQTPMCGVPHHSIGGQINKLLEAGKKVAICDQVEDPKVAKGLVRREVTRVLTPGMVYDSETLEGSRPNYMACLTEKELAVLEATTGECFFYRVNGWKQGRDLVSSLKPVELLFASPEDLELWQKEVPSAAWKGTLTLWQKTKEEHQAVHQDKDSQLQNQDPFSAFILRDYVGAGQGEQSLPLYQRFEERSENRKLHVSAKALSHLEVFETSRGERQGSLFHTIDRTKTSGGARLLRQWLSFPLASPESLASRHDEIESWTQNLTELKSVRETLSRIGDMERRLGRLAQAQPQPRDLSALSESVLAAIELTSFFKSLGADPAGVLVPLQAWAMEIQKAFIEEIPLNCREGGFINKGYHPPLDEWIELNENSQDKIRDLEQREKEATGISSLKVRYNNVFGFYIEVTNVHKDKVPLERYQRKQTLTNAERYCTDELNELEHKVVSAKSRRLEVEWALFDQLKEQVLKRLSDFIRLARACNHLDVVTSLAWLALQDNYVRPQFGEKASIQLEGSRHPVVESLSPTKFIANDIVIENGQCLLLTGPNMAGKSTLMRQVALTVLLAQSGAFVPARQARLPLVDQIFTRIGAGDHLSEGLSTFMVEMQETAEMLNQATADSLVILDEVGRGTSTYDGMSLAQSILEYFLNDLKSYTLFATHYHELTGLADAYPGKLLNKHMAIREDNGHILFRYHLAEGPAHKSYGLQVARLAGVPKSVVARAQKILNQLQKDPAPLPTAQMDLWDSFVSENLEFSNENTKIVENHPIVEALKDLELQSLTPLEALNRIAKWQQELS